MKKTILILVLLLIASVSMWVWVSFNGLPWKKASTAKSVQQYVEEKYAIQIDIKAPFYNFKDGSYGAVLTTTSEPIVEFTAQKYHNGTFSDYYAESVWEKELTEASAPVVKEAFTKLSVETFSVNPVYGMGDELVKGKEIPSYKEVETGIDIGIHFKEEWTNETENTLLDEGFAFIQTLHEKGVKNVGVRLYLKEIEVEKDKTQFFSISIDANDFNKIQTKEEFERYKNIF